MIDFYTYPTINGQAVAIALEMMEIDYQVHWVDLIKGEHREPWFIAINPSGRIPVIVDQDNDHLVISQTGAILIYLAERTGRLLPTDANNKAKTIEWLMFQLTDISTNYFNNFYLKSLVKPKQEIAGNFMKNRAINFYKEFDQQLATNQFICGHEVSITDAAAFPVVDGLKNIIINGAHPHLSRWYSQMAAMPSVGAGMKISEK